MAKETPRMIKAVLFDIGGPLDEEERSEAQTDADIKLALERMGYSIAADAYRKAKRHAIESFAPKAQAIVLRHRKLDAGAAGGLGVSSTPSSNPGRLNA